MESLKVSHAWYFVHQGRFHFTVYACVTYNELLQFYAPGLAKFDLLLFMYIWFFFGGDLFLNVVLFYLSFVFYFTVQSHCSRISSNQKRGITPSNTWPSNDKTRMVRKIASLGIPRKWAIRYVTTSMLLPQSRANAFATNDPYIGLSLLSHITDVVSWTGQSVHVA